MELKSNKDKTIQLKSYSTNLLREVQSTGEVQA